MRSRHEPPLWRPQRRRTYVQVSRWAIGQVQRRRRPEVPRVEIIAEEVREAGLKGGIQLGRARAALGPSAQGHLGVRANHRPRPRRQAPIGRIGLQSRPYFDHVVVGPTVARRETPVKGKN